MTCIVGCEYEGKVYMGCDSAASDNYWRIGAQVEEKVFQNSDMMMGMVGEFRMGQLLKYALTIPERSNRIEDDLQYLVTDYIDAVRETFASKGFLVRGDGAADSFGENDFMLAYRGKLYIVECNFQVLRLDRGYSSIGIGADFAGGVMHYIKNNEGIKDPVKFLLSALESASAHSAGCSPPHHVFCLDDNGETKKVF